MSGLKLFNYTTQDSVAEKGFARDVINIGHFCHFGIALSSKADVEKARHLIELS
jgi:predicted transport protein